VKEEPKSAEVHKEAPESIVFESEEDYIAKSELSDNAFETLCVPTQFTKIGEDYFIVDCYHNQILTSKDKNLPIKEWQQMSDQINMGHTIAGDGVVYLCDDTENNRILIYVKKDEDFYLTQVFEQIGKRPHFVMYDEEKELFYALSSLTGEIYIFERKNQDIEVELADTKSLAGLDGIYIRSFSIIEGDMYLPAGDGKIYRLNRENFDIEETFELPPELGGPTQISKLGDEYYLTVSTDIFGFSEYANIVRAKSIEAFSKGEYESIKNLFCEDGTPYVITEVDDMYYLAWHSDDGMHCLWDFSIDGNGDLAVFNALSEP